jgi:NAD kinase
MSCHVELLNLVPLIDLLCCTVAAVVLLEVGNELARAVDLVITVGGDGTFLRAASLFQSALPLPPFLAFSRGSVSFLAPFGMNYQHMCSNLR